MHTIKITPNLLFGYQCTSGKFIRLPNRIESKKIDSVARIKSNRIETFLPELECSTTGLRDEQRDCHQPNANGLLKANVFAELITTRATVAASALLVYAAQKRADDDETVSTACARRKFTFIHFIYLEIHS